MTAFSYYLKAALLFGSAANLLKPAAQCILRLRCFRGRGVEHSVASVVHWLQLAAAKGHKHAVMGSPPNGLASFNRNHALYLCSSLRNFYYFI
jgi:hypothetical protein